MCHVHTKRFIIYTSKGISCLVLSCHVTSQVRSCTCSEGAYGARQSAQRPSPCLVDDHQGGGASVQSNRNHPVEKGGGGRSEEGEKWGIKGVRGVRRCVQMACLSS